ncbi:glycosyltransferase family 4 protein [Gillisia sp. M10.2A]|uniref:Glycosyltransferase family 4 protein n=1 Tax=Gillisia lutea TaxID=2909668 RepID=A0ABS9EGY6_9FLAO|nr:glycosyltransferase family 4 protein [Gillisia lutea]MCF4102140.1 glycosyltransferase family 4 protein [Gillisia lutea]
MGISILYIGNQTSTSLKNPTTHEALTEALDSQGYNLRTASHFQNKFYRLLHMIWMFFRNLRNSNYILIDFYSTQNFWYAVIIGFLSKLFSKKYILILHGGNLNQRFVSTPRISKYLLLNAYHVVSPSGYLASIVAKIGVQRVTHIPNPFSIKAYHFKKRCNIQPKILWVRAFHSIYNPLLAVKTLELLKREFPNAEMCMVGPDKDGSLKLCRDYADNLGLSVKFMGKLERKEWLQLSTSYDVFINTTNIDNTPMSVIEGMALGLPVVSTRVGGMPSLIEHKNTGLLVPFNDPEAMYLALKSLLENASLSERLSSAGRKKVESLDWDLIKHKWSSILI